MPFLTHIPGTQPLPPNPRHPQAKGVGVIGLHEGRTLLLALASRCTKAYPVAGCDLNPAKIEACRAELPNLFYTADYAAMLARPDVQIVAIYTPDSLHADHIIAAFNAGKDVICTKPLVNSLEAARRILEAGRATGRRLLVGQSTRFFEPFRRQRAAFERGEIGTPELVDAHYIHRMDWYYDKSPWTLTDTDWVYLGMSHPLDLLRWYLGPIKSVQATASRSNLAASRGLQGNDIYLVTVTAESGQLGRAMGHYGLHELPSARNCIELVLYGTEGTSLAQYHDMRYIHTGKAQRHEGTEARREVHSSPSHRITVSPSQALPAAQPTAPGFNAGPLEEVTEDCLYAGRHFYFNSEVHGMHYGEFANYAEAFAASLIDNTPCSPGLEEGVETFCLMEAVRRAVESQLPVGVRPLLAETGL
jgi:predicted dehydrogenase